METTTRALLSLQEVELYFGNRRGKGNHAIGYKVCWGGQLMCWTAVVDDGRWYNKRVARYRVGEAGD